MFLSSSLLIAVGCGSQGYERRLTKTLENMRYQKRLNDNLMPAPKREEGKYEQLLIFIRPPQKMAWAKEFLFAPVEPGRFDLEGSFLDADKKANLHVLARIKQPKNTAKKKTPSPADNVARGEFNTDVLAVINGVYGTDIDLAKFKEDVEKGNKFKHHTIDANDRNVQIYLYGGKDDTHQVALIFEYPKSEQTILISKIKLCLESFAVGARARANYEGAGEEGTEGGATGGGAAGGGVAF